MTQTGEASGKVTVKGRKVKIVEHDTGIKLRGPIIVCLIQAADDESLFLSIDGEWITEPKMRDTHAPFEVEAFLETVRDREPNAEVEARPAGWYFHAPYAFPVQFDGVDKVLLGAVWIKLCAQGIRELRGPLVVAAEAFPEQQPAMTVKGREARIRPALSMDRIGNQVWIHDGGVHCLDHLGEWVLGPLANCDDHYWPSHTAAEKFLAKHRDREGPENERRGLMCDSEKDLPDEPGVWERESRKIRVVLQYADVGPPTLRYENIANQSTGGDVANLPRGNWRKATALSGERRMIDRCFAFLRGPVGIGGASVCLDTLCEVAGKLIVQHEEELATVTAERDKSTETIAALTADRERLQREAGEQTEKMAELSASLAAARRDIDAANRHTADLMTARGDLQQQLQQSASDWSEDHTYLQTLCLAAGVPKEQVEGSSDGVPAISDLADMLRDALQRRLGEARTKLETIVCTVPPDDGVVLLSHESPTHYEERTPGRVDVVYDQEHFSPLGDALIALHGLLTGTPFESRRYTDQGKGGL